MLKLGLPFCAPGILMCAIRMRSVVESDQPRDLARTVNRWTLEPIAFLLPFISLALTLIVIYGTVLNSNPPWNTVLLVILLLLIAVPTVAALRRKV